MHTRGELRYRRMSRLGARLYDAFLDAGATQGHFDEIAAELAAACRSGRVLDVGCGSGRLLGLLHQANPELKLCGLDLSPALLEVARQQLGGAAELQQGSIRQTEYPDAHFDLVTTVASFYLWDYPEESVDEIYRVLKPGGVALLYEPCREIEEAEFKAALESKVFRLGWMRRMAAPLVIRQAVNTSYSILETRRVLGTTMFRGSLRVEKITLGALPIWMRITLSKPRE